MNHFKENSHQKNNKNTQLSIERMIVNKSTSAFDGQIVFSTPKFLWMGSIYSIAIIGGILTASLENILVFLISTAITLCLGHSIGMHRLLIHRSFQCPVWLEYCLVHLGVLVGLAGPKSMMKTHDLRDWAQRQSQCHDYFGHRQVFWKDAFWQIFCDIQLTHPPEFIPEKSFSENKVYHWMEKTWLLQQIPWATLLYLMGGIEWVIWGSCIRIAVSVTGHWLIGYFAHNEGEQEWHVHGASVQGFNIRFASLLTMGESWHNNHHAFPGSAKLGLKKGQLDPGWWVILFLKQMGLTYDIKLPEDLAIRKELMPLNTHEPSTLSNNVDSTISKSSMV